MKRFIIADGIIQGALALSCIICFPLLYLFRNYSDLPFPHLIFGLLGWQLLSSFIQLPKGNKLLTNKYLYYLQLILLSYSLFIAMAIIITNNVVLSSRMALTFYYLFYGGILLLLPLLSISIAIFSVRRMFVLFRHAT